MDKLRIGILGLGNMGSGHIGNIRAGKCPEIEITAVCDIKEERLNWARSLFPEGVAFFNKAEDMFDKTIVDAVIIAVPHYYHPVYAIECMRRGINVMVEKPAGVYTKQVREMNKVADECNVVFGMMFNQRTDHIYRKMRELVQGGTLGSIRRTSWIITNWYRPQAYYDSGDWRATWSGEGGGVLLNQCPHNLDLWQWICGMPTKVTAKLHYGKWHNIEVEDDVSAYVEYANGATGTFITSTGDAPGSNRFEITLDKGKLIAEDGKLKLWELDVSEPEFTKTNTVPFKGPHSTFSFVETDGDSQQHAGVLNAFAGRILHGTPLIADGREGINGLTLSNAMHLSDWTGKEVCFPIDEDLYYTELMKRVASSVRKTNINGIVSDTSGTYNTGN